MEMRCYHKLLRILYKDHVTNEDVRAKVQQAIGPQEDLLITVKKRKVQWYGHVFRSSGSEDRGKMEETGCKIICGAPVTLMVKG